MCQYIINISFSSCLSFTMSELSKNFCSGLFLFKFKMIAVVIHIAIHTFHQQIIYVDNFITFEVPVSLRWLLCKNTPIVSVHLFIISPNSDAKCKRLRNKTAVPRLIHLFISVWISYNVTTKTLLRYRHVLSSISLNYSNIFDGPLIYKHRIA